MSYRHHPIREKLDQMILGWNCKRAKWPGRHQLHEQCCYELPEIKFSII
jgi:hypothetical protein